MNARAASITFPMSPWLEAALAKYGAIGIGLIVGTSAKYGLTLAEGRKITFRLVAIDMFLLGMVALVSSYACERAGITGNGAAMVAALFAVSSDRILRMIRERFLRRMDTELRELAEQHRGEIRQEVQAEISGKELIDDQMAGRAPAEYISLRPKGFRP